MTIMNNKDLYVEIAIKYHGGYESEIDNQVAELHNKLLKYKCGYGGLLLGNYYFIEYQSKLFMEIKRLCEKYPGKVMAMIEYIRMNLDEHIDEYKGFLIEQPKRIIRYNRELFIDLCDVCRSQQLKDKESYEVGKVSTKKLKDYDLFQLGDGIELIYCVTPKLKIELEQIASNSVVFKEITSKSELIAYAILPKQEHNITNSTYEIEKCDGCGKQIAMWDADKKWEPETFYLEDEEIKHPFSWSNIYFQALQQRIIISKECYKVFRKYVDERNFVPIF